MAMNAWVFDIDGVIVDPITKKPEDNVLKHISKILDGGNFVALNTGRSFSWTQDSLLSKLSKFILNPEHFKNFFVVCEKGNVLSEYKDREWTKKVLDDPLPEVLKNEIKGIIDSEFSECMFLDESKETMITAEMKEGFDTDVFKPRVESLNKQVNALIMNKKYASIELKTDPTQISLDVQYEDAGKHLGAERIEDFMMEKGIKPETIYMLGDSSSDVQMAEELEGSYHVIFVFVNDKSRLKNPPMCEVVYTKEKFTKGTLEFLDSQTTY